MAGQCEECGKKRLTMQRRSMAQPEPSSAPPIVHEVLRSPGRPLDQANRAFSSVRVHTDARAAYSARAVDAVVLKMLWGRK